MRRTALSVTVAATLVLGLAGCTSETPGIATPGADPDQPESSESETDSPAACELLTTEEQASG